MPRGGSQPHQKISDEELREFVPKIGFSATAKKFDANLRNLYQRCAKLGIHSGIGPGGVPRNSERHSAIVNLTVDNGIVLIGSDAHIWPGEPSTAMRAFTAFCREMKPKAVILNGDVLDFPQISRHPPIGHQSLPDVKDEIEAAQEQLHEIELAVSRSCKLVWTLGNHDARFETRLATIAPEFAKLNGHSLKNYFPSWTPCWRADINADLTVKHRHKGGIHATHNSTLWAGRTMVTGHLHSAKVTPFTDYRGDRYGVDTGCLADAGHQAFIDYTEAGPLNWRSGFGVLTFKDGKLLMPELAIKWDDDHVQFRGEIIKVPR